MGASFTAQDGEPKPTGTPGTLLAVNIADFRLVSAGAHYGFGVMTGNASAKRLLPRWRRTEVLDDGQRLRRYFRGVRFRLEGFDPVVAFVRLRPVPADVFALVELSAAATARRPHSSSCSLSSSTSTGTV